MIKPSNGWYSRVNIETGEIEDKKWRQKDTDSNDFWLQVVSSKSFQDFIKSKYQVSNTTLITDEELEEEILAQETEEEYDEV